MIVDQTMSIEIELTPPSGTEPTNDNYVCQPTQSVVGMEPQTAERKEQEASCHQCDVIQASDTSTFANSGSCPDGTDPRPFKYLVIDCSGMAFVDPVGIKTFKQASVNAYDNNKITIIFMISRIIVEMMRIIIVIAILFYYLQW